MRSTDKLISLARERTNNTKYSMDSSTGIMLAGLSQNMFVEFINDAQDHLQSSIISRYPEEFVHIETVPLTPAGESYTVAEKRLFAGNRFIGIDYAMNDRPEEYAPLKPISLKERNGSPCVSPWAYSRTGGLFYPSGVADQGYFRVSYYYELDDLDIRRGTISATPSGATIVLDAASLDATTYLGEAEYLCVSDRFGNVMLQNAIVESYDSATRTYTLAASVNTYLNDGYVLADLDAAYITYGKNSGTHSGLPDICERYLKVYLQKRVQTKDSSITIALEDAELIKMEADILETFSQPTEDVIEIPILDESFR